jgi:putative transposase
MAKKRFSPEQVVTKLRQIKVLVGGGESICRACKEIGITDVTYYRWRREYGSLKGDEATKLKELKRENAILRRMVADLLLEKAILNSATEESIRVPNTVGIAIAQSSCNLPAPD